MLPIIKFLHKGLTYYILLIYPPGLTPRILGGGERNPWVSLFPGYISLRFIDLLSIIMLSSSLYYFGILWWSITKSLLGYLLSSLTVLKFLTDMIHLSWMYWLVQSSVTHHLFFFLFYLDTLHM